MTKSEKDVKEKLEETEKELEESVKEKDYFVAGSKKAEVDLLNWYLEKEE